MTAPNLINNLLLFSLCSGCGIFCLQCSFSGCVHFIAHLLLFGNIVSSSWYLDLVLSVHEVGPGAQGLLCGHHVLPGLGWQAVWVSPIHSHHTQLDRGRNGVDMGTWHTGQKLLRGILQLNNKMTKKKKKSSYMEIIGSNYRLGGKITSFSIMHQIYAVLKLCPQTFNNLICTYLKMWIWRWYIWSHTKQTHTSLISEGFVVTVADGVDL